MLVGVNNGANYYKLNPAPWNNTISDWTPFSLGSTFTGGTVTGATIFTDGLTADTFSLSSTPAINTTNNDVLTLNQSTGVVEQRSINSLINVVNLVTVGLSGSSGVDYYSIKEAVDSISGASASNTFVVKVGPGVFNEDPITMKSYVDIIGESGTNTIIQANDPNQSLIIGADQSMINNVQIQGCIGTDVSAVVYSSPTTPQLNAIFYVENVRFGANYTHAKVIGTGGGNCIMQCSNVKYGGYPFTLGFYVTNDGSGIGRMQLRNVTSTNGGVSTTSELVFAKADQPSCAFIVNGALLTKSVGVPAGIGFWIENGGVLRATSVNFQRWSTAIYAPQTGSAPSIDGLALNFEGCTTDVNIIHSGATGKIQGTDNYAKTLINIDAPLYEVNQDPRIITVAKKGGDFTSVKSAVDSISGSSITNRFLVSVGPGKFIENEIDLTGKPYVSIEGSNIITSQIVANTNTQHIFKIGQNNEISFLSLSGAPIGYAAIYVYDIGDYAQAHKISFTDCDTNVWVESQTQDTIFYGEYLDFNGEYSYGTKILAYNGYSAYANMENYYNLPTGNGITIGNHIQGFGATLSAFVADGIGNGVSGSTNYQLADYASLNTISTTADNWGYGIRVLNNGGPSRFDVDSYSIVNSMVYDLSIEHLDAEGTFGGGSSSHTKINNISDKVYWAFLDTNDGEFEVTRKISVTFTDGTHTDMSTLIFQGSTMGLIHGGVVTSGSGLTVNVSTGYGYVEKVADAEIIKRIDWDATSVSLSSNSSLYLFFNESGTLSFSGFRPAMKNNIILGRVVTNSTGIEFIDVSPMSAEHTSNRFANLFREAIGPLYAFGSIVTENATPFKLNISAGEYYYSTNEYIPSGATGSTFTQYYNNGAGGWNTSATTFVNKTQFDNNGVLSGLTASAFTKHTLYIVGDGIYEKYFLVLGQNQYSTLVECENALLPTPPTFFNDSVAQIANIYIKQGNPNILQIEDIRPVIGFKAGGVNASSLHANLLGLTSDDHKQYLLGDGSRAMTGTLNMGNNPIISAGTINGVTITSHAARHKHGGADEISTNIPAGSAIPKADAYGKLDTWISNASSTITGTTKLSVNPAVATNPIAVGVNDPRFLQAITGVTTSGNSNLFKNVSGGTTTINDVRVTGGTYNPITGTATFKNSINNTFDVIGFFNSNQDNYVVNGVIEHDNNQIVLGYSQGGAGVAITDIVTVIQKDINAIEALISNNELVKGVTYKIINCDSSLYLNGYDFKGGNEIYTTIYLKAIETNVLADTGVGEFYTPKYNNTFNGVIWSNLNTLVVENIVGEFIPNEQITSTIFGVGAATGTLFGDVTSGLFYINGGDWESATQIFGLESGASADIVTLGIISYDVDDILFWGGSVWSIDEYFKIGASVDIFNLDTTNYHIIQEFPLGVDAKIQYYNISYDEIKYDIVNDRITYRKDKNNNIVSTTTDNINYWIERGQNNPIKAFKWGHDFTASIVTGIGNQKIVNSYNENINFRGLSQYNIEMDNLSYQYNTYGEGESRQADLYLSKGTQRDIKLVNSYQRDLTLINSSQRFINISTDSIQQNVRLENVSEQNLLTIANNSTQRRVIFKNNSTQNDIIIRNDGIQSDIVFENNGSQTTAIIENQARIKFYNFPFDRGNDIINEVDKIYTNTLATNNSAPQVIGILDNELVEVDVSTFVSTSPIELVNTSSLFSTPLSAGTGSNATDSNFFGQYAGNVATNSNYSNFIGNSAGYYASGSAESNFFGTSAGYQAKNSIHSNFFGASAGGNANNANYSNFFGTQAGILASGASNSNFFGQQAGYAATGATSGNFLGQGAGGFARNANDSNFLGFQAGYSGTNATYSNFLGRQAGFQATGAAGSNFFGFQAGLQANDANNSNFFGNSAGNLATGAAGSNFFGASAGNGASNANNSNFFGNQAGNGATNASSSNFLGYRAGYLASFVSLSNFLGEQAGDRATVASNSNFMGYRAGSGATSASQSNFFGINAGQAATNANNSNFFGSSAGSGATTASFSNLFGFNVGRIFTGNNIGANNIIIGKNISLPNAATNSINIGGVLFGSGTYSNQAGNPSITGQTNGRIGINVVNPTQALHVSGNTLVDGNLTATTISATNYFGLPIDVHLIAGTYSNGTATFTNNTGGTFNVAGFSTATTFNGGTVSGPTNFTSGLTANTIGVNITNPVGQLHVVSNTFAAQPVFERRTGGIINGVAAATAQFLFNTENTSISSYTGQGFTTGTGGVSGTTVAINFAVKSTTDTVKNIAAISAGLVDYAAGKGQLNFTVNNSGIGLPSMVLSTDGNLGINNTTPTNKLDVSGSTRIQGGLSANTISATTYNNLPKDVFTTGGTYSAGTAVFSNNTGGTFSVSGFSSGTGTNPGLEMWSVAYGSYNGNVFFDTLDRSYGSTQLSNNGSVWTNNTSETLSFNVAASVLWVGDGSSNVENIHTLNIFHSTLGYIQGDSVAENYNNNLSQQYSTSVSCDIILEPNEQFYLVADSLASQSFVEGRLNITSLFTGEQGPQGVPGLAGGPIGISGTTLYSIEPATSNLSSIESIFFGLNAGQGATNAAYSNFFGSSAGQNATAAFSSNFLGQNAGQGAIAANYSNFLGQNAGFQATGASSSNFLGVSAGNLARNASYSNFIGQNAGNGARNANSSNFFGNQAGNGATNASSSNFMGSYAGQLATGASYSNFYGSNAGVDATNAYNSNFFGQSAGSGQSGASYSNFYGSQAGAASGGIFLGSNNIIIGNNITLPQGASNSLNIGGVLFGTNFYSTFGGTPFSGASSGGRIGVAVVNPTKRLHIYGETANDSGLRLERLTSASPTSAGQAIGVDSNGNVVTVAGGVTPIYTAVTTSSVLTNANQTVIVNSSTDITITLPQIIVDGTKITIKNINTGIETILPYSGQLIDGDTSVIVARKNVSLDFQSYNNNWYLI